MSQSTPENWHSPEVMTGLGAPIVDFETIDRLRPQLGRIVVTSGPFDPIHPGHISCILDSKHFGDTLVVIVNGDSFLQRKKGKAFQYLPIRCQIVSSIRSVDYVVPFEIEDDQTVNEALARLKPAVFTKGGDRRDAASIPEWETCRQLGIEVVTGVGWDKKWSSSDFLRDWEKFRQTLE